MTPSSKQPAKPGDKPSSSGNLLKNRFVAGIFKSRWYPGIFQWPTALVFLLIINVFLFGESLAEHNFGTALTWVLWWPLLPIIFLLAGRFWCSICPFSTLSDLVRKFVGHNRPVPTFLKKYGIWIIDAVFIFITWADHVFGIGIIESPWGSGVLMLMIVTAVVATAVLWERRSWCRYLCFFGGFAGNYSQAGILALRGTPEKCSACKDPICYKGNGKVAGCPMFEFPKTMTTNAQCNLCGNCVKTCPHDSITLKARVPTEELWSIRKPQFAVAFFAVIIVGIVFVQNITMLGVWKSIVNNLGNALHTSSMYVIFTVFFAAALLIPFLLIFLASFVARKFNGTSTTENFTRFGYSIVVLSLAGHMAHNLFHLLAEGRAVLVTGAAFFGKTMQSTSSSFIDAKTIQYLQYGLVVLGIAGSIYTAYRIARSNFPKNIWTSMMPYAVLTLGLGVVTIISFSVPMEMRMSDAAAMSPNIITTTAPPLTTAIAPPAATTIAPPATTTAAPPATATTALPVTTTPTQPTATPTASPTTMAPPTPPAGGSQIIDINGGKFNPSTVNISTSTAVTFVNEDMGDHDFVSASGPEIVVLDMEDAFYTFTKAGTYQYSEKGSTSIAGIIIVS